MPAARSRGPAKLLKLGSSFRTQNAELSFEQARQVLGKLGISRVTDVTRLDRLGLPVHASIRPRGQVLRVHAGKGLTASESRIGAAMEAIEFAVADPATTPWQAESMNRDALESRWADGLRLADFPPRFGSTWTPKDPVPTVTCDELNTGRQLPLPAELIFFPFEPADAPVLFGSSTTGLASGNTLDEATLHGLFEVLERDAMSMNKADDRSQRVPSASLPPPFKAMAARWAAEGIALAVRHVPNEFGLPCFESFLHEPNETHVPLCAGSGLHIEPRIALARSICEAAQSRLSAIHGGRDDIDQTYAEQQAPARYRAAVQARVARLFDTSPGFGFKSVPGATALRGSSIRATLSRVLTHLRSLGFKHVFRHRFDIDLGPLQVVKVVVPRCEDVEHGSERVGQRLTSKVVQRRFPHGHA